MAIAKAKARVRAKVRIKAILYRLKDSRELHIGKVIKRHYRHLNNSNLNFLTILFLIRKLYTSLDITRNATI